LTMPDAGGEKYAQAMTMQEIGVTSGRRELSFERGYSEGGGGIGKMSRAGEVCFTLIGGGNSKDIQKKGNLGEKGLDSSQRGER